MVAHYILQHLPDISRPEGTNRTSYPQILEVIFLSNLELSLSLNIHRTDSPNRISIAQISKIF